MSSQQAAIPPTSFQNSIISGNLNSSLLVQFLSGAYFGFYFIAVWIYSTKHQSRQRVVVVVLAVLFASTLGQLILAWYYTYNCFAGAAKDRLEMYKLSLGSGSKAVSVVNFIMLGMSRVLADGLMIWRSWHILAQRGYIRWALLFLYVSQVALIVVSDTIASLQFLVPSDRTVQFTRNANFLQASSLCVTAATSIIATVVISAHIYSSSRMNRRARKRYMYIIEITIQSSALYSVALLIDAITGFILNASITLPSSTILNTAVYTDVVTWIMAAFAPTLMVARLALAKDKANEDVTTDIISEPNDGVSSAVPENAQTQTHSESQHSSNASIGDGVHSKDLQNHSSKMIL